MAHKHSRRRIRPRSRNNNNFSFNDTICSNSDSVQYSLDGSWLSDTSSVSTASSPASPFLPPGLPQPKQAYTDHIIPRYRKDQHQPLKLLHHHHHLNPVQNREQAQKREAEKLESQRVMLFGGEKGENDDFGLCGKMSEVFRSMGWIDEII